MEQKFENDKAEIFKGLNKPHNKTNSMNGSNGSLNTAKEVISEVETRAEDGTSIAAQQAKEIKYERRVKR